MVEEEDKITKEQFCFLCWIVLFDLECSERRVLCNVFSTHMADCVTAKHTGGVVVVVVGGGSRQTRRKRSGRGRQ